MKRFNCLTLLLPVLLAAMSAPLAWSAGNSATVSEFWGILAYSDEQPGYANHLVSFAAEGDGTPYYTSRVGFAQTSTAGAYAAGTYYLAASTVEDGKEVPDALFALDIDNGSYEKVGNLTGYNSLINDMSYDYATSTMYAVARIDNSVSALYAISLTDASSRKVATLDRRFFTLACDLDGQLYGVSFDGEFCKIDKTNGQVLVVGHTGLYPEKFQSMEFDHERKQLHWACTARRLNDTGTIEIQESFMATIDPATGSASRKRSLGDDQIAGLYIPFRLVNKGAPTAVENLTVTPAPQGGYQAVIRWTNPTKTFGGDPIKAISKVEVYRDDVLVTSLTNQTTGRDANYTDMLPATAGAFHTYKVVAYTAAGDGLPNEATAFIGVDIPASVGNLSLERLGANRAKLSWSPVTTGANGGWTDVASMSYTVVRMPDNVTVADKITATEYEETGVETPGTYTYQVTASNNSGSSTEVTSEAITLGPKLEFPLTVEFNDYYQDEQGKNRITDWTVVDANEDGNSWEWFNLSWAKATGAYFMTKDYPGDDYLISHSIEFDSNSTYKMTIRYFCQNTHQLELLLLNEYDWENPAVNAAGITLEGGWDFATKEIQFSVAEGGDLNLALRETTPVGNSYLLIDRMVIEKLVDKNLGVINISGNPNPNLGNTYPYLVTVINRGKENATSFTVNLIDQNGNTVGTTAIDDPLASGEERVVAVKFTAVEGITSLQGKVVLEGDAIANDDVTTPLAIQVMPAGTPEAINIGEATGTTRDHPFNLYRMYSAVNQIYSANEIGVEKGRIYQVAFPYNMSSYSTVPENVEVKLYLANTQLDAPDGWMNLEDMTLAYEGLVNFERGDNYLTLPLNNAFDYEGGNLAVVCQSSLDQANATYFSGLYWKYYKPSDGTRAYCYASDYAFDYGAKSGSGSYYGKSCVTLMIQTGGAQVKGHISDSQGAPIEGAEVRIEPAHASALSDADGNYTIAFVPNGDYTLIASKKYYEDATPVSFNMADDDRTINVVLEKLPTTTFSAKVTDKLGNAIEGALIRLDGYETLTTLSDPSGSFTFADVVAQASTVTVTKDWYAPLTLNHDLGAGAPVADLTLDYAHYTPSNIDVELTDGIADVSWSAPDTPCEQAFDSGVAATQFGLTNHVATAVMGTAFRTPMLLESVKWLTTSEGGPHNAVNIYIYALDDEGNPSSKLLFSANEVPCADDEWSTFTLPQPVSAPNGCLVTLNYHGFLGLGIDNDSRAYPFRENTYWFSVDFNSGEFAPCDLLGLNGNLMLRAAGRLYPAENSPVATVDDNRDALPEWMRYNVWRAKGYDAADGDWTLVNSTPLATASITDSQAATLAPGAYRYAVTSVYPDGSESDRLESHFILVNAFAAVTINAKTNSHSANAAGAKVEILSASGEPVAAGVIDNAGQASFPEIWKDSYVLRLDLPGYATYEGDLDLSRQDAVSTPVIVLEEIIAEPFNLAIQPTGEKAYKFTWNESGEIFDSFEDYNLFEAPYRSDMPWSCLDIDGGRTFAEADFDFAGRTKPMSFIVFDPSKTSPSMYEQRSASRPHSGNAELACFASVNGNNDWLITPKLTYHQDYKFSFYARGYSSTYVEVIKVGYSTKSNNPEDFVWIGEPMEVSMQQWKKYEFNIPADACYLAINAISPDGFTLFIDDLEIGSGTGMTANTEVSGPEVTYEITLDGNILGTTQTPSMLLNDIPEGRHVAGVTAVYASGRSAESVMAFGTDGITAPAISTIRVYPNPAHERTFVKGEFTSAILFSLSGQLVGKYECTGPETELDLRGLQPGLYLLLVNDGTSDHPFKLIVQ